MSITQKNQLLVAYKKLLGKAHTNSKFGAANEAIASSVQLSLATIFASGVNSTPSTTPYSITGNAERLIFDLEQIDLSQYQNSVSGNSIDKDGESSAAGIHAYKLKLPVDYNTNSNNPRKGFGSFNGGSYICDSNGSLQMVPPSLGAAYNATVKFSDGVINPLDDEDYIIDYYSGILFVQDPNRIPVSVEAFIYIGLMSQNMKAYFSSYDNGPPTVEVVIVGGTPPYTYNWSIAKETYTNKTILSPANSSSVVLINDLNKNSYAAADSETLLKLEVTDSTGYSDVFYHNHNVVGYHPMQMNINREITASFCSEVMMTSSVPRERIDFLDSYEMSDMYEILNTIKNFATNSLMETDYREAASLYSSNLQIKFVADRYNQNHVETTGIVYSPPEFDVNTVTNSMLTMSKNIVSPYNTYFREFNILNGCEAYQYSYYWNLYNNILTGSIYDHVGNVKLRFLPSIEVGPPIDPGVAGDIVDATGSTPSSYAWSNRDSQWNEQLAYHIYQIETDRIARSDSNDWQARNMIMVGLNPFLAAAYYLPLHKIR